MKKTMRHVSVVTSDGKEGEHEGSSSQSVEEFAPGSLIWVKLEGDTWWPAQVLTLDPGGDLLSYVLPAFVFFSNISNFYC